MAAILGLLGSLGPGTRELGAEDLESSESGTPIGALVFSDHRVVLISTSSGVRFSVFDDAGRSVASEYTAAQLEARFPRIAERIRSAIARPSASGDFIWAGG